MSDTSIEKLPAHLFFRPLLLVIVAAVIVTVPGGFWFTDIWCTFAIGGFLSVLISFVWNNPVTVEPINSRNFRLHSLTVLVASGLFSLVALIGLLPSQVADWQEEKTLTNLTPNGVDIYFCTDNGLVKSPATDLLSNLVEPLRNAHVHQYSHEGPTVQFVLSISSPQGRYTYKADIPERSRNDVRISFKRWMHVSHISIPGLGQRLKDVGFRDIALTSKTFSLRYCRDDKLHRSAIGEFR